MLLLFSLFLYVFAIDMISYAASSYLIYSDEPHLIIRIPDSIWGLEGNVDKSVDTATIAMVPVTFVPSSSPPFHGHS